MFCQIAAMNEKAGDNVLTNYECVNVYNEQVHKSTRTYKYSYIKVLVHISARTYKYLYRRNGGEELQGAITGYHLY